MNNKVLTRAVELVTGKQVKILYKDLDDATKLLTKTFDRARPNRYDTKQMLRFFKELDDPKNVLHGLSKRQKDIKNKFITEKGKVYTTRGALLAGAGVGTYKLMDKKAEIAFEKTAKKKKTNILRDAAAGGIAGAAGTTLTHSLENVQIKQTGAPGKVWSDTLKKLKTMYTEGTASKPGFTRKLIAKDLPRVEKILGGLGTKGIYRGLPIKLLKVVPAMGISLPIYTYFSKKFNK